jgi:hypothetical protein
VPDLVTAAALPHEQHALHHARIDETQARVLERAGQAADNGEAAALPA